MKTSKKTTKGKPVVIKPKVPRAKTKKFALLHVPSGNYLKLSSNSYSHEAKNQIFKYNKIHTLINTLLRGYSRALEIKRLEPIGKPQPNIILYVPGTNTKIGDFNLSSFMRTDCINIQHALYLSNNEETNKQFLEDFRANPNFEFCCYIEFNDNYISLDSFTNACSFVDEDDAVYKIIIHNTESWDTIMLELFKYMQENQYSIKLRQFSKDERTEERILLTEFEIVEIM